ncbi:hypothetical protein SAMN02910369_01236 [Lachnospiraceae bacterium NE2001]|nr:hypothetical protein SAMN02910369_01236 [Lachnospiraceae bacterium NE2001]
MKKKTMNNKTTYCNNGSSMIVAIIIMSILVVFTFSLTLIAYTLYASQNKNISSMRCSQAANTLSDALAKDITYEYENASTSTYYYPEIESWLYRYIRFNLCQDDKTWPYYVNDNTLGHTKDDAYRYFTLYPNKDKTVFKADGTPYHVLDDNGNETTDEKKADVVEGKPGKTTVCIYWELPEGVSVENGKTIKENYSGKEYREGIKLFIEVTCEAASESYTVKKEFILKIEDYKTSKPTDTTRYEYLKKSDIIGNTAVNPFGLEMSDMYDNEKWTWKQVEE